MSLFVNAAGGAGFTHDNAADADEGSLQNHFLVKLGFWPNEVGGLLTESQLFQTKTTTIQKGDFVGIFFCNMAGFPSPNQKITKNHMKIIKKHQSRNKWDCTSNRMMTSVKKYSSMSLQAKEDRKIRSSLSRSWQDLASASKVFHDQ